MQMAAQHDEVRTEPNDAAGEIPAPGLSHRMHRPGVDEEANSWSFAGTLRPATKARTIIPECDHIDHPDHAAIACAWRKFRAFHRIPVDEEHYIDDIYLKVLNGELAESEGLSMLERFLERSKASRILEKTWKGRPYSPGLRMTYT